LGDGWGGKDEKGRREGWKRRRVREIDVEDEGEVEVWGRERSCYGQVSAGQSFEGSPESPVLR